MDENAFKILFGKKLKHLRKQKNLTQEIVSEKVGIETHNWSKIETGKTFPHAKTLAKILTVLDIEPAELFEFTKSKTDFDLKIKINQIIDQYPEKAGDFYKILVALTKE